MQGIGKAFLGHVRSSQSNSNLRISKEFFSTKSFLAKSALNVKLEMLKGVVFQMIAGSFFFANNWSGLPF
jgi:hypothetical protein